MNSVDKYANITDELPKLQKVLLDAIQSEFLEILAVDHECDKFQEACKAIPALSDASFVVFSKFIKKSDHRFEKFIFLDKEGHEVCNVSGEDMDLYGLLAQCVNLELTQEYEATHPQSV